MSVQDAQEAQEAQDEQEVQDALMVHYAWLNATILPFTLDQLAEETSEFRRQVYVAGVGITLTVASVITCVVSFSWVRSGRVDLAVIGALCSTVLGFLPPVLRRVVLRHRAEWPFPAEAADLGNTLAATRARIKKTLDNYTVLVGLRDLAIRLKQNEDRITAAATICGLLALAATTLSHVRLFGVHNGLYIVFTVIQFVLTMASYYYAYVHNPSELNSFYTTTTLHVGEVEPLNV